MYRMTCLSRSSSRGECKLFPNFGNISPENRLQLRLYCENHLENRFSVLVILKNANSFSSLNTMSWKWCNGKWDTSRNVQYEEFERTKLFILFDLFQKRALWVKRQKISNIFNAEFVRNAETRSNVKVPWMSQNAWSGHDCKSIYHAEYGCVTTPRPQQKRLDSTKPSVPGCALPSPRYLARVAQRAVERGSASALHNFASSSASFLGAIRLCKILLSHFPRC